jgi:hypothetical protein
MATPSITLKYFDEPNLVINFDPLDRARPWLEHMVLLLWTLPRPVIGFVHPMDVAVYEDDDNDYFTLQHALEFHGQVGLQPVDGGFRPAEGPKVLLPFSLISPLEIVCNSSQGLVWVENQTEQFKEVMNSLIMNFYCPPMIKVASQLKLPQIGQR